MNMYRATRIIGIGVLSMCMAHEVVASAVPVVNAGFEDISGESPFNEFTFGPLNGWDLYDPNGVTDGGDGPTYFVGTLTPFEPDPVGNPGVFANFPGGAAEGQRVAIAFNFAGSDGQGEYGLQQTLAETLAANTTYVLQVEIGNIDSATAMNGQFFELQGFPGYRVDLLAGGVVIAQDNNSLAGSISDGEFSTSSFEFTTGQAHPQLDQALGIRVVNLNVLDPAFPASDIEVDFDDVRLDARPAIDGDLDVDGFVNVFDLLDLLAAWGDCDLPCPPSCDADITNADGTGTDCAVDVFDLLLLLSNWSV